MATKAMLTLLTSAEKQLVAQTSPKRLDRLDEDKLIALLDRVRRARNKYAKLHRRQASAQVKQDAARGVAGTKNQRTSTKAEIFEEALSRVTRQLSSVSRREAKALRSQRLADAKRAKTGAAKPRKAASGKRKGRAGSASAAEHRSQHLKSAGRLKKNASVKSKGKRRQAKRDSR